MKKHLASLLITILFSNILVCQAIENSVFIDSISNVIGDIKEELVKVTENIYIIQPYGLAGNTGVFISADGVILIDDQWSMLADRIREMVLTISDKEIKTIINTHYHFDHTNGNIAFGKFNIPIISQENALIRMSQKQVMPTFFNVVQEAYPEHARPSMTFMKKFILHEQDETIELIHMKNAHTDGDLFVHFKKENVYHTGDIFITHGLPHIDELAGGDIYGILEAVDYLLQNSNQATKFIPGHGPLSTVEDVKKYRDLLKDLLTSVEELTKSKMEVTEIIEHIKSSTDYSHYSGDDFIRQVHRSVLRKLNE